ncbi:hypothetical protein M3Y99_01456500 [Aphelenchoides fujianensis]|nr:hypothetical protein M3Y99_01456500 [Aphelenchoides fujianensis]
MQMDSACIRVAKRKQTKDDGKLAFELPLAGNEREWRLQWRLSAFASEATAARSRLRAINPPRSRTTRRAVDLRRRRPTALVESRRPRDSPNYAAPPAACSSTLFSRDRPSNGEAGGYRASPYRRPDDRQRPPERYESPQSNGSHPSASHNNERRSWYAAGSAGYPPPVRNSARYFDPPLRSNSPPRHVRFVDERATCRSSELDVGHRQNVEDRHRPLKRPREDGGSFTPPEPKRASNGDASDSGLPATLPSEPLNLSMIQPETLDYEENFITLEEEARLLDDYDLKSPEEPQIPGI